MLFLRLILSDSEDGDALSYKTSKHNSPTVSARSRASVHSSDSSKLRDSGQESNEDKLRLDESIESSKYGSTASITQQQEHIADSTHSSRSASPTNTRTQTSRAGYVNDKRREGSVPPSRTGSLIDTKEDTSDQLSRTRSVADTRTVGSTQPSRTGSVIDTREGGSPAGSVIDTKDTAFAHTGSVIDANNEGSPTGSVIDTKDNGSTRRSQTGSLTDNKTHAGSVSSLNSQVSNKPPPSHNSSRRSVNNDVARKLSESSLKSVSSGKNSTKVSTGAVQAENRANGARKSSVAGSTTSRRSSHDSMTSNPPLRRGSSTGSIKSVKLGDTGTRKSTVGDKTSKSRNGSIKGSKSGLKSQSLLPTVNGMMLCVTAWMLCTIVKYIM